MQNHIPTLEKYLRDWKLTVNPAKSSLVVFTSRNATIFLPRHPRMNNVPIPPSFSIKYLGIALDEQLTFREQIEGSVRETAVVIRKLFPILIGLDTTRQNKPLLFKAVLRPILLYGAPVWGNAAGTHIRKVQVSKISA